MLFSKSGGCRRCLVMPREEHERETGSSSFHAQREGKKELKKRGKQVCMRRTQLPMRFQFDLCSLELRQLKKQTKKPPAHITKNLTKTASPNRSVPRSSAGSAASPTQPQQHERDGRGPPCSHGSSQPPIRRDRHSSLSTAANRSYQTLIFPFPSKGTSPVPRSQLSSAQPLQASVLCTATATATVRPHACRSSAQSLGCPPAPGKPKGCYWLSMCTCICTSILYLYRNIEKYYFPLKKVVPTGPQSAPSQGMFWFYFFCCQWILLMAMI